MQSFLEIGQIVNTNGLKGVMKVIPFTDDITRFERLNKVYIEFEKKLEEFEIEKIRYQKNTVLIKFKGIDDIDEAEKYKEAYIKIKREDARQLDDNEYFIVDLIGIDVYTEKDELLGILTDVYSTKSNDIYVIKDELGKQILLPAISDVIKNVDIKNKKMIVHLIPGLL